MAANSKSAARTQGFLSKNITVTSHLYSLHFGDQALWNNPVADPDPSFQWSLWSVAAILFSGLGVLFVMYRAIAVIEVAPTGKASFVYSYVQTRLRGQYNGKWPFSLVYVLKPLITAIRAIVLFSNHKPRVERCWVSLCWAAPLTTAPVYQQWVVLV